MIGGWGIIMVAHSDNNQFAPVYTMRTLLTRVLVVSLLLVSAAAADDRLPGLLRTLQQAKPGASDSIQLAAAWRKVSAADVQSLPTILAALDDAGPLGANWIRTAVDAIAQRADSLPAAELERFVMDRSHNPRGRRLAYEWLVRVDASAPERLLPKMLDDPGKDLRRDAVDRLIHQAESSADVGQGVAIYRRALDAASDVDQIQLLAGRLDKAGHKVDLARQMGFLVQWNVSGPFDNTGEKGFDAQHPPEKQIDLAANYDGKHGKVGWIGHTTKHAYGLVDLNKLLVEEKGVLAYAMAAFVCDEQQDVEFRTTSFSAVKLWLNGELIDQHNVYHGGSALDQYIRRATLRPGRNTILLKICQNEQTQDWAKHWAFQLRVCRKDGTPVLSTDRN